MVMSCEGGVVLTIDEALATKNITRSESQRWTIGMRDEWRLGGRLGYLCLQERIVYRIDSKQVSNQELGLPLSEVRLCKEIGSFRGRGRPCLAAQGCPHVSFVFCMLCLG